MSTQLQELRSLAISIEKRGRQLFTECLGYEPDKFECQALESLDLLINVERAQSSTENFLHDQNRSEEGIEMGLTINRILNNKLALVLISEFDLPVAEVSFLTPIEPTRFSLFVLLTHPHSALSQEAKLSQGDGRTTRPSHKKHED